MIARCPDPIELAAMLDRELPERRAGELRVHVDSCSACGARVRAHHLLVADVRAPAFDVATAPIAARILAQLDAAPSRSRAHGSARTWFAGATLATAAVVGVLVVRSDNPGSATMQARGGGGDQLSRRASASLYVVGDRAEPVRSGAAISTDSHLVVGYRNLDRNAPVYLTAFAEDSARAIHWLYPAYERLSDDPRAIELPFTEREALLSDNVVLDRPAAGRLRVVIVISRAQPRVSTIEGLAPAELAADALRARWPDAVVSETVVELRSAP